MRLLILGDPYNLFVINFAEALHKSDGNIIIDILSNTVIPPKTFNFEDKPIPYHHIYNNDPLPKLINKIPLVRTYFRKAKAKKALKIINNPKNKYDVILIHGIWEINAVIFPKINIDKTFVIASIWGSDYYDGNQSRLFKILEKCNIINVSNPEIMEEIINTKSIPPSKFRNCKFGLAPLGYVYDILNFPIEVAKEKLQFKHNEFIITCGYNGTDNHQHLKILQSIKEVKDILPPHTRIVLPMTYGTKPAYKVEVVNALENCGIPYKIFETFLKDKEVAYLRRSTDLMLQLQKNDALSGSMQEHLLAKNIVITGSWLPYKVHKDKGIYYETIDQMSELKDKLTYVFENLNKLRINVNSKNTPEKFKESLWSESIKDWKNMLYEYKQ